MRRMIALALVVVFASIGAPISVPAQESTRADLGMIAGEAVDAGGRPLANQRVELVQGGVVLQSTTTGVRGEWRFSGVLPGEYVVRMVINGQVAGIRVSVAPGQTIEHALIVAPSAAAPSAAIFGLPFLLGFLLVAGAAAVVTTIIIVTAS